MPVVAVEVHRKLWFLLRRDRRRPRFEVAAAATDTVGHVVQMVGVPLTEVGVLHQDGRPVPPRIRLGEGHRRSNLSVEPRTRPESTGTSPPRFLLDVHLGSLARRLRLLGLDTAYRTAADDDHLVRWADTEGRVLLTRDRGLLSRTALGEGALVRGDRTADQLDDVLDRFAPTLTPWTRCLRCNTVLVPVRVAQVAAQLEPGTRRTYQDFSRCPACERVVAASTTTTGPAGGLTSRPPAPSP